MGLKSHYIIDFSQIHKVGEDLVNKKIHELGMLWKLGIPLPRGFVITTNFFKEFLRLTGIGLEIKKVQSLSHPAIADSMLRLFQPIQKKIIQAHLPQNLATEIHNHYRRLSNVLKEQSLSISTLPIKGKSFYFSNIKGDANFVLKIKEIWSLRLDELTAIVVQENILPKITGKIFTDNPTIDKRLTKPQMDELINYCKIIQKHFYFPKEIEYILNKGKIFITKVNPFTGTVNEPVQPIVHNKARKVLVKGISINPGIATGKVKILHNYHNNIEVKKGEIIVLPNLFPSMFKKMKNAKAIVTDSIAPNSLNKALYRKNFKIPTIEGTKNAAKIFQNGNVVTVNGMNGEIYSGGLMS